jgi:hypothetical protein
MEVHPVRHFLLCWRASTPASQDEANYDVDALATRVTLRISPRVRP